MPVITVYKTDTFTRQWQSLGVFIGRLGYDQRYLNAPEGRELIEVDTSECPNPGHVRLIEGECLRLLNLGKRLQRRKVRKGRPKKATSRFERPSLV